MKILSERKSKKLLNEETMSDIKNLDYKKLIKLRNKVIKQYKNKLISFYKAEPNQWLEVEKQKQNLREWLQFQARTINDNIYYIDSKLVNKFSSKLTEDIIAMLNNEMILLKDIHMDLLKALTCMHELTPLKLSILGKVYLTNNQEKNQYSIHKTEEEKEKYWNNIQKSSKSSELDKITAEVEYSRLDGTPNMTKEKREDKTQKVQDIINNPNTSEIDKIMAGVTLNSINNVASREEINTTPSNDLLKLLDDKIEELNDQIIQKAIKIKSLEVYYE